jgi:hypothetical protein
MWPINQYSRGPEGSGPNYLPGIQDYRWEKITSTGVYFVDVSITPAQVKFFGFATKKSKNVTHIDLGYRMPPPGF